MGSISRHSSGTSGGRKLFLLAVLALNLSAICSADAQNSKSLFPLKISADRRHLTDNTGTPFLYNADTSWMLFLNLTQEEALVYLADRKSKSFNVIQVILTGFADSDGKKPVNRYERKPFLEDENFSVPDPEYMNHVERVIKAADSLGLALNIAPLWAGCCGEGWTGEGKAMDKNGSAGNQKFGEYLGKRFGKYNNVMWIMGGDNDPGSDKENYRALALGLKKNAPQQLITYHAASSHSSTDVWQNETWLDFSIVYTYFRGFNKAWNKNQPDVYEVSLKEYAKTPLKPFILGESTYEGEHDAWGSALQVRKQAYWVILSGGTGNAYGSPLWKAGPDWRDYLNLPGAASLKNFYSFFTSLPWEKLVPDSTNKVAVSGMGTFATNNFAVTAIANDKSFCVSYLPGPRTIRIDLTQLKTNRPTATWFNPETGEKKARKSLTARRITPFTPPKGKHDWLLVIAGSGKF